MTEETMIRLFDEDNFDPHGEDDFDLSQFGGVLPSVGDFIRARYTKDEDSVLTYEVTKRYFSSSSGIALLVKKRNVTFKEGPEFNIFT